MAVKMRLQRKGRRKAPYYHIVVADARSPRDGKFIERLGFYNPMTKPATIEIDREKAYEWLTKGAQPTETVNAILKFKGVLYKKHLMRGVKKGALSLEDAETKYQAYVESKDSKVAERFEQTKQEKEAQRIAIFGKAKEIPVVEETPIAAEEAAVVKETLTTEADNVAAEEPSAIIEETKEEATVVDEEAPATGDTEIVEEAIEEAIPTAEAEALPIAESEEIATENTTEVEEAPVVEATEEVSEASTEETPTEEGEGEAAEEEDTKEEK